MKYRREVLYQLYTRDWSNENAAATYAENKTILTTRENKVQSTDKLKIAFQNTTLNCKMAY